MINEASLKHLANNHCAHNFLSVHHFLYFLSAKILTHEGVTLESKRNQEILSLQKRHDPEEPDFSLKDANIFTLDIGRRALTPATSGEGVHGQCDCSEVD